MQVKNHPDYKIFEDGSIIGKKGNPLKPVLTSHGYLKITLDKRQYQHHVLVAKHFVPNHESKPFVNHKDGNKLNNHASNLEWCSTAENNVHARENLINKEGRKLVKIVPLKIIVFGYREACRIYGNNSRQHLVKKGIFKPLTPKETSNVLSWFQAYELNTLNDLKIKYIDA